MAKLEVSDLTCAIGLDMVKILAKAAMEAAKAAAKVATLPVKAAVGTVKYVARTTNGVRR